MATLIIDLPFQDQIDRSSGPTLEGFMLNQFIWGLQPDLARSVSLHYPTSIAKAVSLAETMEVAVKASRRPNWKSSTVGNPTRAQISKIGAEVKEEVVVDHGVDTEVEVL